MTLIGGLRNPYNIASITIFSSSLFFICTVHYLRINQTHPVNFEETEDIPGIIIILGMFLLFWNFYPFLQNVKLRKFAFKTICKQFQLLFEDLLSLLTRLWKIFRRTRQVSPATGTENTEEHV